MTALHLMVMGKTVVMEKTVVTEKTVVMERTVVTERAVGVRMAQRGNDNGCDDQSRDDNGDDRDEESQHSGLGACSTPSSQRADVSTKEQTSQAEEPPRKRTEKTGTPPSQPPAKGANKRKGKTPRRKFPGFLQDGAQYTGPCLRKAMRYPKVNRKKPVLYLHPIHKAGQPGRRHYRTWATHTGHGSGHMRQEETDTWCGLDGSGQG